MWVHFFNKVIWMQHVHSLVNFGNFLEIATIFPPSFQLPPMIKHDKWVYGPTLKSRQHAKFCNIKMSLCGLKSYCLKCPYYSIFKVQLIFLFVSDHSKICDVFDVLWISSVFIRLSFVWWCHVLSVIQHFGQHSCCFYGAI